MTKALGPTYYHTFQAVCVMYVVCACSGADVRVVYVSCACSVADVRAPDVGATTDAASRDHQPETRPDGATETIYRGHRSPVGRALSRDKAVHASDRGVTRTRPVGMYPCDYTHRSIV